MSRDDRTLDESRLVLAPEIARAAVFDGWSDQALCQAAALAGVDTTVARLAFPGGPMDLICAWIASTAAQMQAAVAGGHLPDLTVRDRSRTLLLVRRAAVAGGEA